MGVTKAQCFFPLQTPPSGKLIGGTDMGPDENDLDGRYYMINVTDGCRPIASFEPGPIPTVSLFSDELVGSTVFPGLFEPPQTILFSLPLPKTRKRFVKLFMSWKGVDRNTANAVADMIKGLHGAISYASLSWNVLVEPMRIIERG